MYIEQHLLKFAYDAKNHMAMGSNPREKTGNVKPWMAKIMHMKYKQLEITQSSEAATISLPQTHWQTQ